MTVVEKAVPKLRSEHAVAAVIDALGFKAAYRPELADELVNALRSIHNTAHREAMFHGAPDTETKLVSAAFSDSLVVIADAAEPALALYWLGAAITEVVQETSVLTTPFLFRGCISVGQALVVEDLFVGSAVNCAAEWSEKANAAIVWVRPEDQERHDLRQHHGFLEWDVPLRDGTSVRALALNPFWSVDVVLNSQVKGIPIEEAVDAAAERMIPTFGSSPSASVETKRRHTERFLAAARAHTIAEFRRMKSAGDALESETP